MKAAFPASISLRRRRTRAAAPPPAEPLEAAGGQLLLSVNPGLRKTAERFDEVDQRNMRLRRSEQLQVELGAKLNRSVEFMEFGCGAQSPPAGEEHANIRKLRRQSHFSQSRAGLKQKSSLMFLVFKWR